MQYIDLGYKNSIQWDLISEYTVNAQQTSK